MRVLVLTALSFVVFLTSTSAQDRSPAEAAYFALKSEMSPLLRKEWPNGGYSPGYLEISDCGMGYTFMTGASDQQLAYAMLADGVTYAKLGLQGRVPEELWRPELIRIEESLLIQLARGMGAETVSEAISVEMGKLVEALEGGNWGTVTAAEGCGAGETIVNFTHPVGSTVEYMHAGIYHVCEKLDPSKLPMGFCDWNSTGEVTVLSGRFAARLRGSSNVQFFTVTGLEEQTFDVQ